MTGGSLYLGTRERLCYGKRPKTVEYLNLIDLFLSRRIGGEGETGRGREARASGGRQAATLLR